MSYLPSKYAGRDRYTLLPAACTSRHRISRYQRDVERLLEQGLSMEQIFDTLGIPVGRECCRLALMSPFSIEVPSFVDWKTILGEGNEDAVPGPSKLSIASEVRKKRKVTKGGKTKKKLGEYKEVKVKGTGGEEHTLLVESVRNVGLGYEVQVLPSSERVYRAI
jgi:hypothetical protein